MNSVSVYTLSSGSSGNCTYVQCGETAFLIDAGISRKAIIKALATIGRSLQTISAIFVTHEHVDHIRGIKMLAKYDRIPIYISPRSQSALCDVDETLIRPMECSAPVTLGEATVTAFPTLHDALSSCGYTVRYRDVRLGYATDMGQPTKDVTDALTGCRAVILEANYDKDMLQYGPYPYPLKQRIAGKFGHLDNDTCAAFCSYLGKTGTQEILLAHLSLENNTPEKAYKTVLKKLEEDKVSLTLGVAARYEPTELLTLPC